MATIEELTAATKAAAKRLGVVVALTLEPHSAGLIISSLETGKSMIVNISARAEGAVAWVSTPR